MKKVLFTIQYLLLGIISFSQIQYPLGEIPFNRDEEQSVIYTIYSKENYPNLPSKIDLSSLMPPAGDQGSKGSCWAWATTYALRSWMDNTGLNGYYLSRAALDMNKVFSPEYVYQVYKGDICNKNFGANSAQMLDRIIRDGVVKEVDFRYNPSACNIQPTPELVLKAKGFAKKGFNVYKLDDLYSIKKILADKKPLVISMIVDNFFCTPGNIKFNPQTNVTPTWTKFHKEAGSHAMVIVGYDDDISAIKVLNSWGPEFGKEGYVWISYELLKDYMNYACFPQKEIENIPITESSIEEIRPEATNSTEGILSTWFKKGYFRPFDNLKIVLAEFDEKAQFAIIEIRDWSYKLKSNFYIEIKNSKQFFINGKKYQFTFENIGKAGVKKRPKAVYFTVKTV